MTYPIILKPTPGASIVKPVANRRKNKKHGPSEIVAFARLLRLGLSELRSDLCVRLERHNYEPDMVYIAPKRNVYIDIEVDEPYAAAGHPTHYVYDNGTPRDGARNRRFQDAGWWVVRFSEEQVFSHTEQVAKTIHMVLREAGVIDAIPARFDAVADLAPIEQWTQQQSQQMKRRRFRNSYLHFDPARMRLSDIVQCGKLLVPIALQSTTNAKLRRDLWGQTIGYIFKRR